MLGISVVFAACCLLVVATSAQAASVTSLTNFSSPAGANNNATDDSAEYLYDVDGDGGLSVGDVIFGIWKFPTYNGNNMGNGAGNPEWTGFYWTMVLDMSFNAATGYQFSFGPDTTGSPFVTGVYNPVLYTTGAAGSNQIADLNLPTTPMDSGTMMVFYEDAATPPNWQNSGGPGVDEQYSTDGAFFWALGMNPDVLTNMNDGDPTNDISSEDERWVTSTSTLAVIPGPGVQIGDAQFSLNRRYTAGSGGQGNSFVLADSFNNNYTLLKYGSGPAQTIGTEFTGSVAFDVPAAGSGIGWPIHDNITTFNFKAITVIPLPAAAWMGLALLGVLGVGRRFRHRS
jgi:hypothetical protein